MRRTAIVAAALLYCACPSPAPTPDGGPVVQEDVPFEGETSNGPIPEVPPTGPGITPVDAGTFTTDRRCCNLVFTIDDREPAGAVGAVVGTFGPFENAGLPLGRDGGVWSAAACFPLGASTQYAYQLTWWVASDGGSEADGGSDGGTWVVAQRFNDTAPNFPDGLGGTVNYVPAVTDCAALDASVGMLP